MEYKAAQIPRCSYDSLSIVKAGAIANKVRLPKEILNPKECPICNKPIEEIEVTVKIGYRKCGSCGYEQPIFNLGQVKADVGPALADLGKGALIALGIAALAYLVSRALE